MVERRKSEIEGRGGGREYRYDKGGRGGRRKGKEREILRDGNEYERRETRKEGKGE